MSAWTGWKQRLSNRQSRSKGSPGFKAVMNYRMRTSRRVSKRNRRTRRQLGGRNWFPTNNNIYDSIIQYYWDQTKALQPSITLPKFFKGYIDFLVFAAPQYRILRVWVCYKINGLSATYLIKGDEDALNHFNRLFFMNDGALQTEANKFMEAGLGDLYIAPVFIYNEAITC